MYLSGHLKGIHVYMEQKQKLIQGLQEIVTGLSQQADGHNIQSKIFASQGFSKLGKKYAEHVLEERSYVDQLIDRILDLGGQIKNSSKAETPVYNDPIEWIKYDLKISQDGLAWLATLIKEAQDDLTTFDILKEYYKDEEDDMFWAQQQLELIEKIGEQNWLYMQV